tara:strand:- start:558 stop:1409 length:852 start_codon:yes stop_codon:yes gene_type:complete
MKIGIIGYGFVGKALAEGLTDDVEIYKVDPKLNTSLIDLKEFRPNVIFICLPTPMNEDGSQDISILKNTLLESKKIGLDGTLVLKSTVHPGNIDEIKSIYSKFVYNPEFLREKHAKEDFVNSNLIVFGGDNESSKHLAEIYLNYTKCVNKDYVFTDAITASLIKYTINSFLATKVIFFNEIKNLFESTNANESWSNFIKYLSKDKRIGSSHMDVPGHDGRLGFGGACLPKDANALLSYSKNVKADLNLLQNVIKTNNKIRASYDEKTHREHEQNINYNNLEKE